MKNSLIEFLQEKVEVRPSRVCVIVRADRRFVTQSKVYLVEGPRVSVMRYRGIDAWRGVADRRITKFNVSSAEIGCIVGCKLIRRGKVV